MTQMKVDVVQGAMWSFIRMMIENKDLTGIHLHGFGKIIPSDAALSRLAKRGIYRDDRRGQTQKFMRRVPKYMVKGKADRGVKGEPLKSLQGMPSKFNSKRNRNVELVQGVRLPVESENTQSVGTVSGE